jgi:hypothetical protein
MPLVPVHTLRSALEATIRGAVELQLRAASLMLNRRLDPRIFLKSMQPHCGTSFEA